MCRVFLTNGARSQGFLEEWPGPIVWQQIGSQVSYEVILDVTPDLGYVRALVLDFAAE